jgi:hypothetical protein
LLVGTGGITLRNVPEAGPVDLKVIQLWADGVQAEQKLGRDDGGGKKRLEGGVVIEPLRNLG